MDCVRKIANIAKNKITINSMNKCHTAVTSIWPDFFDKAKIVDFYHFFLHFIYYFNSLYLCVFAFFLE